MKLKGYVSVSLFGLTHCDLVSPFGAIYRGQYWIGLWLSEFRELSWKSLWTKKFHEIWIKMAMICIEENAWQTVNLGYFIPFYVISIIVHKTCPICLIYDEKKSLFGSKHNVKETVWNEPRCVCLMKPLYCHLTQSIFVLINLSVDKSVARKASFITHVFRVKCNPFRQ